MSTLKFSFVPSGKLVLNTQTVVTDGFTARVNMEILHAYAVKNGLENLNYSMVRACFIRDVKAGKA